MVILGETMKLSILGCPDRKNFAPFVKRAAIFYSESLLTQKMLENVHLRIRFVEGMNIYGSAMVEEVNFSGKPREFTIELNPVIGAAEILKTLAHEMVHVKQYVYRETNEALTRWKGIRIDDSVDYYDQPWEIEAHGMEVGLFTKFAIQEQLWNIFEGIQNPDSPIVKQKLGWK
jgi:hypothetical protein